jgi:hypothetical protein
MVSAGIAHASDNTCPSIATLNSGMSGAIAEAELEQAGTLAAQVKAAVLCDAQQPHQTMLLAQVFRTSGTAAYFKGDMAGATEAFTLAASISPGEDLEKAFGQQAGAFYAGIRDKLIAQPGASIKLVGEMEAWIDGRPLRAQVARDVTAGPHILQTRKAGGAITASEITLASGEDRRIPQGEASATVAAVPAATPKPAAKSSGGGVSKNTLMMGGGGALIAAGVGMLAVASSTHGQFDDETDPSKLEGLQSKTNMMGTLGIVTSVAGVGLVGATMLSDGGVGLQLKGRW